MKKEPISNAEFIDILLKSPEKYNELRRRQETRRRNQELLEIREKNFIKEATEAGARKTLAKFMWRCQREIEQQIQSVEGHIETKIF